MSVTIEMCGPCNLHTQCLSVLLINIGKLWLVLHHIGTRWVCPLVIMYTHTHTQNGCVATSSTCTRLASGNILWLKLCTHTQKTDV